MMWRRYGLKCTAVHEVSASAEEAPPEALVSSATQTEVSHENRGN